MDLVASIAQVLRPVIVDRVAASLELKPDILGKALAAAVPAILAGLAGLAARASGAVRIMDAVSRGQPSLPADPENLLASDGQPALIDWGNETLTQLLGRTSTGALAGALGRFTGLDSTKSRAVAGIASAVVLTQLAQIQRTTALNAGGMAKLLRGQKDRIAAALPAGFANLLDGSSLLDTLGENLNRPASSAQFAPAGATRNWVLPLVIAVIGVYGLSSHGCDPRSRTTAPADPSPGVTAPEPEPETVTPPVDVIGLAAAAISILTTTLATVTDEATAEEALPTLEQAASQLDSVKAAAANLPAEAKATLAKTVSDALPGMAAAIGKAVKYPGVAAILNPVLRPLAANLDALTKT